jgi:hypothetical protein
VALWSTSTGRYRGTGAGGSTQQRSTMVGRVHLSRGWRGRQGCSGGGHIQGGHWWWFGRMCRNVTPFQASVRGEYSWTSAQGLWPSHCGFALPPEAVGRPWGSRPPVAALLQLGAAASALPKPRAGPWDACPVRLGAALGPQRLLRGHYGGLHTHEATSRSCTSEVGMRIHCLSLSAACMYVTHPF